MLMQTLMGFDQDLEIKGGDKFTVRDKRYCNLSFKNQWIVDCFTIKMVTPYIDDNGSVKYINDDQPQILTSTGLQLTGIITRSKQIKHRCIWNSICY